MNNLEGLYQRQSPSEEIQELEKKIHELDDIVNVLNNPESIRALRAINPELADKLVESIPEIMEQLRTLKQRKVQREADATTKK
jgi:hypothetical protein